MKKSELGIKADCDGFSMHLGVLIHLVVIKFLEKISSACSCMRAS